MACISLLCSVNVTAIMGKAANLTVVQMTINNILHEEVKPQNVSTEKFADCFIKAYLDYWRGNVTGKRCTGNTDDHSLVKIVKKRLSKDLDVN